MNPTTMLNGVFEQRQDPAFTLGDQEQEPSQAHEKSVIHAGAAENMAANHYFDSETLTALMYWLPKLSISYCPFFLSKRIFAAAMI